MTQDYMKIGRNQDGTQQISPLFFGSNIEHTRSCVWNGLSAQLLKNRKFAGKPGCGRGVAEGWFPIGEKTFFSFDTPYTHHAEAYHMHRMNNLECNSQNILNFMPGTESGFGQYGLKILEKSYEFRIVAKSSGLTLKISLTDRSGEKVYDSREIRVENEDFTTYETRLTPAEEDRDAALRLTFTEANDITIGAVSLMPADHFRGMRKDVLDRLKEMGLRILRWPGGNFAGEYNWLDGLMPVDMRAPFESYMHLETQPATMGFDYHEINTDDFAALCRYVGAEPFITINPVWNTPEESAAWVEYCNGDETTEYGRLRISRGYAEPYNVKYWSLGNEMGYSHMEGDKTPAGYAKIARRNAEAMLQADPSLILCSSGPYPNPDWNEYSANALSDVASLVSFHHYSPSPTYRLHGEEAKREYEEALKDIESCRLDLRKTREGLSDRVQISFDEWNTWYAWYRPSAVYDGIFAASMFHMIFSELQPLNIGLVCYFEAINEGAIKVDTGDSSLTAIGQIFRMMKEHTGGKLLHVSKEAAVTLHEDGVVVTLVNDSYDSEKSFDLTEFGAACSGTLFTGELLPYTVFDESAVSSENGKITMPAHSAAMLKFGRV